MNMMMNLMKNAHKEKMMVTERKATCRITTNNHILAKEHRQYVQENVLTSKRKVKN